MELIRGYIKKDTRTKNLIGRLHQNDIALIFHKDLDEVAATHLAERRVQAVINCDASISGKYPNQGPRLLMDAGIPLIDNLGKEYFDKINEGDLIEITDNKLYLNNEYLCSASLISKSDILLKMEIATANMNLVLEDFVNNTLDYAEREKDIILSPITFPTINTKMKGTHVLVVIRGRNYKEDLKAIRSYVDEVNPIMIGVDGGGDALLEFGYKPDLIIGDMDSVSDQCLSKCKEIIVHAYSDGRAPGMERVKKIGLDAKVFPYPGTSEDIALLLAFEHNAELIVTVGSHTSMIDFLEKGRRGMASTLLVRMKVGFKVIDAKGVSELYKNRLKPSYIAALFMAALFPVAMVASMSPWIQNLYRLIVLRFKILIGL